VRVCVCVSDAAVAMFSVQLCYFERRDAVRRAQSSTARMRIAIILGCTALLIAATAIARGFGLQVFLAFPGTDFASFGMRFGFQPLGLFHIGSITSHFGS